MSQMVKNVYQKIGGHAMHKGLSRDIVKGKQVVHCEQSWDSVAFFGI